MYSMHNEGKSVVAERFMISLKNKIYRCMTLISKSVCIDKLDDIANKYNNTYNRTIRNKPVDTKSNAYINSSKEIKDKDSKFKKSGIVRKWRYKNTVQWICVISNLKGEQIVGTFYRKAFKKTNQKDFSVEKVIKRKGDKLHAKWKGYDNSFNIWVDKNDIV